MTSHPTQERIVAIALCALSVFGTLALFGSVPLLAKITTPRQGTPHTEQAQPKMLKTDS